MSSASVREWIRWESDTENQEPTSTLVLTSPGKRFVDIRILIDAPVDGLIVKTLGILQFAQLDWAFAGFSSSEIAQDEKGQQVVKSTWTHFVDSHYPDAEKAVDSGLMYPQPHGRTLEKGSMLNPKTSKVEAYEELWKDVSLARKKNAGVECAVLHLQDDKAQARGMVVRLGQYCQGFVRVGEQTSLERWEYTEKGGWQRTVRMGDMWLPCGVATEFKRLQMDAKLRYGDDEWVVVELSES